MFYQRKEGKTMDITGKQKGFTLIELVMVIVILGILAAVAVPKFTDLSKQAKLAATKGIIGAVQSGIGIYYANSAVNGSANYPTVLDSAGTSAPTSLTPYFSVVLGQGAISDQSWSKNSATQYKTPSDTTYTYTPTTGQFLQP
jgi:prepilin-type N-terminal cleavage/methylation domain-containing protein